MKYIRTKEHGVCKITNEDDYIIHYHNSQVDGVLWKEGWKGRYKAADTIEELCDRFVYRQQLYEDFEFIKGQDVPTINHTMAKTNDKIILSFVKDQVDMCDDKHIFNKTEWGKVYGAIWTSKGLIYVAKINEKGELELL